jgi:FlaG/FlaF family flagellin (archaellin)
MKVFEKRGLSPVVATMLLVGLAIALAAIVFIWALSIQGEQIRKNNGLIESSCGDVAFTATASSTLNSITITNEGNIPLFQLKVSKKEVGSVSATASLEKGTVLKGETVTISAPTGITFASGETLELTPVLLGEQGSKKVIYACNQKYAQEVQVG